MGEDSCRGGGGMCTEKKPVVNSAVMSTCSEEDNDSAYAPGPEEDCDEELEYGPGIVSKLRTRFLSITLKQQNRGLLKSNMRRSCSLENLLDQGRSTQDGIFNSGENCAHGNGSNGRESLWSNLKRAKSMDSLLLGDQVDRANEDQNSQDFSKRDKCEIAESLTSNNHHIPKLVKRKEGVLNRSTVIISDEELPKPDTVKIYKRMFEPADAKRGMPLSNVRRKPPVLRASAKIGTATAAKVPAHHQRKVVVNGNAEVKKSGSGPAKSKLEAPEKAEINGTDTAPVTMKNGHETSDQEKKPEAFRCRSMGKKSVNPPIKEEDEEIISNGHDSKNVKDEPVTRYRLRAPKKPPEINSKPSIPPKKPTQVNKKKVNLNDKNAFTKKPQAPVAPKPAEITQIRKETDVSETTEVKKHDECNSGAQQKEEVPVESKSINGEASTPLTNGHVCDSQPSVEPVTSVDSSLINNQITEDTEICVPSEAQVDRTVQKDPSAVNLSQGVSKTPLWQHKPHKGGCGNSMVFDFRGKDVVHHLSVQPVPFGNKALRTRCLLIDGKEAIPYTNGSVNGGVRDGATSNEDEDEEYEMDYSYPPPSGITFEGENIIIGKGSMLTVRNKSLKIQFDDDVNDTFVYPSESSLLEECESPTTTNGSEAESDATEDDGGNDENDFANGRPPRLRANTTIGITGGLATYTPSVLRTVDNFEPGMFRPAQNEMICDGDKSKHESPVPNGIEVEAEDEAEMLKPADPELISAWSLSTSTSDLLF